MTDLKFGRNKSFLDDSSTAGITIDGTADPAVMKAITSNEPLPDKDIVIGNISLQTQGGKDVVINGPAGQVRFGGGASASAFAGLGVYRNTEALIQDIELTDFPGDGLSISGREGHCYSMLRWGYDVHGSATGSIVLNPAAQVKFGAEGKREGLFAVIREYEIDKGARSLLRDTVSSWILPSAVHELKDLRPGTWLVTEIESALGLRLTGQFGYHFNWVKAAKLGGLSGDIGLRLQLGVETALGFRVGAKFAAVLSRPDEARKIRLKLYKQRMKGWDFALDSGARVSADFDALTKESFDDFIKAVFGTHGAQVLLQLEKWTDPSADLEEILGEITVDYFNQLVEDITGLDSEDAFEEGKARINKLLERWHQLDHEIGTKLWKLLEQKADLESVRSVLIQVTEPDDSEIIAFLEEKIADIDFFKTAAGDFLLSLIPEHKILSLLTDSRAYEVFEDNAQKALDILDGSILQETLKNLQEQINDRLNLDVLQKNLNTTDFKELDAWLKSKLADFAGSRLNLSKIKEIQRTVHLLLERRHEFYEKTIRSLNKEYQLALNVAYQRTTTRDALIDIEFDFTDADPGPLLHETLTGNFERIFTQSHDGVKIHKGVLTHGISQRATVEVDLPFYKSSVSRINNSLAKTTVVDEDEGRILLYELGATDRILRRDRRSSTLTIGGYLPSSLNAVNVHSQRSLSFSYEFREARKHIRRADLEYLLSPFVATYCRGAFSSGGKAAFSTWLVDLDKTIDRTEFNGTDNFGSTLIALQVAVPSAVTSAWLKAPSDKRAFQYLDMSRRLQKRFKELLLFHHFCDAGHYRDLTPSGALLAFCAIAPSTQIKISGGKPEETGSDVYWNWRSEKHVVAMLNHPQTAPKMREMLFRIHHRLLAIPGLAHLAPHYSPQRAASFLQEAVSNKSQMRLLESLLFSEVTIVRGAFKAARKLADFVKKSNSKPQDAVKALAEFGEKVTTTLNKNISTVYDKESLRPLGSMLFIEAAQALDPALNDADIRSLLDIIIIKQDSDYDVNNFLAGIMPDEEVVLLQERVVGG